MCGPVRGVTLFFFEGGVGQKSQTKPFSFTPSRNSPSFLFHSLIANSFIHGALRHYTPYHPQPQNFGIAPLAKPDFLTQKEGQIAGLFSGERVFAIRVKRDFF